MLFSLGNFIYVEFIYRFTVSIPVASILGNHLCRRARAGFPVNAASLQQTVDCLTRAELSVAVYVQSADNKTTTLWLQADTTLFSSP